MEKRCIFLSYIKGETMWAMGSVLGSLAGVLWGNTRHEVEYDPSEKAVGCRQINASSFVGVDWQHWASRAHTLIL